MDSSKKGVSIVVLLSIVVIFVLFGEQRAEWTDEREYKNESGITRIIAANSERNNLKIKLEFIGHLGEIDSEDENYLFYRPCDIAGDSEGNLYVLEAGNHRVKKFDNKGKLVFKTSRPVPDEMHNRTANKPNVYTLISQGIDVDSQGRIWIITRTRRLKKKKFPLLEQE